MVVDLVFLDAYLCSWAGLGPSLNTSRGGREKRLMPHLVPGAPGNLRLFSRGGEQLADLGDPRCPCRPGMAIGGYGFFERRNGLGILLLLIESQQIGRASCRGRVQSSGGA